MDFVITSLLAFNLIGIATQTTNMQEMQPAMSKIPMLWQTFFSTSVSEKIPNKSNTNKIYAVYTNYESDYTGKYTLIIGSAVTDAKF